MAELLDRDLYRKIKRMDRKDMEAVLQEFYNMGKESVEAVNLDISALKKEIGQIKGIGESRLNEIVDVIEKHIGINENSQ